MTGKTLNGHQPAVYKSHQGCCNSGKSRLSFLLEGTSGRSNISGPIRPMSMPSAQTIIVISSQDCASIALGMFASSEDIPRDIYRCSLVQVEPQHVSWNYVNQVYLYCLYNFLAFWFGDYHWIKPDNLVPDFLMLRRSFLGNNGINRVRGARSRGDLRRLPRDINSLHGRVCSHHTLQMHCYSAQSSRTFADGA